GPEIEGEMSVLTGSAPVATMGDYQREITSYTRGKGRLTCNLKGYEPCHNAEEVIQQIGYEPDGDLENPTGSVFCSHGAGFVVNWNEVDEYAHIQTDVGKTVEDEKEAYIPPMPGKTFEEIRLDQEELEEIFTRTYGPIRRDRTSVSTSSRTVTAPSAPKKTKQQEPEKEYLLVDGYNIIFS
ncbi:small GTP-binding protein, partial [gut metagenome]